MSKSWGRLLGEELLLWGKAGAGVAKDFAETGMTELGRCSGLNDRRVQIESRIAFVELAKKAKKK